VALTAMEVYFPRTAPGRRVIWFLLGGGGANLL